MRAAYDAIVVGGGPAGATAATLLAGAGWRVAVIEKAPFPRPKVCGEYISGTTWPLLRQLGVADDLLSLAAPVVRRVGLYAGDATIAAPLATATGNPDDGGRALGRDHLDATLLRRARDAGAEIWQPWSLAGFVPRDDGCRCTIVARAGGEARELDAGVVVAAHGSWESGPLPTQRLRRAPRASDLFGFKVRFRASALPADLMPLLAFPGGYGGMVHTDGGLVSLSCCIRRDELARCRRRRPQATAGEAVLAHIVASCRGVALAVDGATRDGAWLSAGPLATGLRTFGQGRIFAVGNAAAEAHPVVAEGISMAIQSSALLCTRLLDGSRSPGNADRSILALGQLRAEYGADWRRNFSRRLHASALFAHLFMHPAPTRIASALLAGTPQLLALGARWSGKAEALRGADPLFTALLAPPR